MNRALRRLTIKKRPVDEPNRTFCNCVVAYVNDYCNRKELAFKGRMKGVRKN